MRIGKLLQNVPERLSKLKELTPVQRGALARALVLLPAADVSLRVLGFRRSRALFERSPRRRDDVDAPRRARQIARAVDIAAGYGPYRATCLRKAMALRWLLAREGISSELKLGVRKGCAQPVDAHAWVEAAGEVFMKRDDGDESYAAFGSLPDAERRP